MMKRLFAWVLVLAMVLSAAPMTIFAEGEVDAVSVPVEHSHDAAEHKCAHCDATATWSAWGDTDAEKKTLPTESGHYYLVSNITKPLRPRSRLRLTSCCV